MNTKERVYRPELYARYSVENADGIYFVTQASSEQHARNKFRSEYPEATILRVRKQD